MFAKVRQFFLERRILEVDCPIISAKASVDAHIDLIPATYASKETRYMHSSPEYGMKRLLSEGIGDIYQLSHVFRDGEFGQKHNPEFMMAEWYRQGISFEMMIQETCDFVRLFVGDLPHEVLSYREVFRRYAGIDYFSLTEKELLCFLKEKSVPFYPGIEEEEKDALLNLILGTLIEPHLGQDSLFVLAHYPASQAALARTCVKEQEQVAERFEIYYRGIELANGYHELTDVEEQEKRFISANAQRQKLGKTSLPIDDNFLKALRQGLPDACGVAVGFDRLMMLRHHKKHLKDVIPFDWSEA